MTNKWQTNDSNKSLTNTGQTNSCERPMSFAKKVVLPFKQNLV